MFLIWSELVGSWLFVQPLYQIHFCAEKSREKYEIPSVQDENNNVWRSIIINDFYLNQCIKYGKDTYVFEFEKKNPDVFLLANDWTILNINWWHLRRSKWTFWKYHMDHYRCTNFCWEKNVIGKALLTSQLGCSIE